MDEKRRNVMDEKRRYVMDEKRRNVMDEKRLFYGKKNPKRTKM